MLGIYRCYFYKSEKKVTLAIFAIAVFLHNAALVILIIWIVLPIVNKHKVMFFAITAVLLLSFTSYTNYISMISGNNTIFAKLLVSVLSSADNYQTTSASFHSLFVRCLQMIFSGIVVLRGWIVLRKKEKLVSVECQKMCLFSIYSYLVATCLTTVLGTNGNRFFIVTIVSGLIPFMESCKIYGFLKAKALVLIDFMVVSASLVSVALYLNDMNWGTGSTLSLFESVFFGALSRSLI